MHNLDMLQHCLYSIYQFDYICLDDLYGFVQILRIFFMSYKTYSYIIIYMLAVVLLHAWYIEQSIRK